MMTEMQSEAKYRSGIQLRKFEMLGDMVVEHVSVPDVSNSPEHAATKDITQADIAAINEGLRLAPEYLPPQEYDTTPGTYGGKRLVFPANEKGETNVIAEYMYQQQPALEVWRANYVPTAVALTALYEPESDYLPYGEPIDPATKAYFIHSYDAIGIRSRAAIMSNIARRYVEKDGSVTKWTSIACGAAIPVLNALEQSKDVMGGIDLKLVDRDTATLNHALEKASDRSLVEGEHFTRMNRDVIEDLIKSDKLIQEIGYESQQMVDVLGLLEYIDTERKGLPIAAIFLHQAYKLVKPGGVLVAGNMLDSHPQLHFNQRAIGWPIINPRSVEEMRNIFVTAQIDPANITTYIPEDGVYAVFEIRKPLASA